MLRKEKYYAIKAGKKETESYIKNVTDKQAEIQLLLKEINKKHMLQKELEKNLGFTIPEYIVEAISEIPRDKNKIFIFINLAVMNKRMTKENAEKLRKYVDLC